MALEDILVNLTPHPISISTSNGVTSIPASGSVARVSSNEIVSGDLEGVPVIKRSLG